MGLNQSRNIRNALSKQEKLYEFIMQLSSQVWQQFYMTQENFSARIYGIRHLGGNEAMLIKSNPNWQTPVVNEKTGHHGNTQMSLGERAEVNENGLPVSVL